MDTNIDDSQNKSSKPKETRIDSTAVTQPSTEDHSSEAPPVNTDDALITMESEDDDKSVSDEFEWNNYENDINTNDIQPGEVSTQTDEIKCDDCANKSKKIEYFEILEKEHKDLLVQHERFTTLYYDQADEKQVLSTKIVELEQIKIDQSKEILKMKRETVKLEKNLSSKICELEKKLKECYDKVDKYEQDNVKLAEEKKTLEELRKIDNLLGEEQVENGIDNGVIEQDEEMEAEVIDIENNDPDDDDIIAFYLSQAANRSNRTDPVTEAIKPKPMPQQPIPKNDNYACNKCAFKTGKEDTLKAHTESNHKTKEIICDRCENCKFVAKTETQMKKHFAVRHTNKKTCWHWEEGECSNIWCRFEHPPRLSSKQSECFYQERCQRSNCQYSHSRIRNPNMTKRSCRYQELCKNRNCPFEHFLDASQATTQGWW